MPTDPSSSDQDREDNRAPRRSQRTQWVPHFSRSTPQISLFYRSPLASSVLHHNINSNDDNDGIENDYDDDSSSSTYDDLPPLSDYDDDRSSSSDDGPPPLVRRVRNDGSSSSSEDDSSNSGDEVVHEVMQPLQSRTERSSSHLPTHEGLPVSILNRLISLDIHVNRVQYSRRLVNSSTTSDTDRQTSQSRYNGSIFIIGRPFRQAGTTTTAITTTTTTKNINRDVYRLMFADGYGPRDRLRFYADDDFHDDDEDDDDIDYDTDEDYDDDQDSESDDDDDEDDDDGDDDVPGRVDNRQRMTSMYGSDRSRRARRTIVVWDGDVTTGRIQQRRVGNSNHILTQWMDCQIVIIYTHHHLFFTTSCIILLIALSKWWK